MFDLEKLIEVLRTEFEGLEMDNANLRHRIAVVNHTCQTWKKKAETLEKQIADLKELQRDREALLMDSCERAPGPS